MPARNEPPRTCDYCNRPHVAFGCCRGHYARLKATGDVQAHIPLKSVAAPGSSLPCNVPTCDRKAVALGFCQPHHWRLLHHGDVQADIPIRTRRCSLPDCNQPHFAKGLCRDDLEHLESTGDVLRPPGG